MYICIQCTVYIMYVYIYIYIYVCVCVHLYIYISIYNYIYVDIWGQKESQKLSPRLSSMEAPYTRHCGSGSTSKARRHSGHLLLSHRKMPCTRVQELWCSSFKSKKVKYQLKQVKLVWLFLFCVPFSQPHGPNLRVERLI